MIDEYDHIGKKTWENFGINKVIKLYIKQVLVTIKCHITCGDTPPS